MAGRPRRRCARAGGPADALTPDIAARLTDAAKLVTGHWTAYSGAAGPGARAYFLIDAPELTLPAVDVVRLPRIIGESLMSGMVTDHWRALCSYARLRGLPPQSGQNGAWLSLPGGRVDVSFDGQGRIAGLAIEAHGTGRR